MSSDSDSLDDFSDVLNHSSGHKLVEFIRKKRGNPFIQQKLIVLPPLEGIDVNIDFVRLSGNVDSRSANDAEEIIQAGTLRNDLHKSSKHRNRISTNLGRRTLLKEFEKTLDSPFYPPICSTPVAGDKIVSSKCASNVPSRKDSTSTSALRKESSLTESIIIISDTEESNSAPDKIVTEIKEELQPSPESKTKVPSRHTFTIENSHPIQNNSQPHGQPNAQKRPYLASDKSLTLFAPVDSSIPQNNLNDQNFNRYKTPKRRVVQRSQAEVEPCVDKTHMHCDLFAKSNVDTELPIHNKSNREISSLGHFFDEIIASESVYSNSQTDMPAIPLGNTDIKTESPEKISPPEALIGCTEEPSESNNADVNSVPLFPSDRREHNSRRGSLNSLIPSPHSSRIDCGDSDSRTEIANSVLQSRRNDREGNNFSRRSQSPELETPKNNYGDNNSRRETPNPVLHSCRNDRGGNNSSRRTQSPVLKSPKNDHGNNNSRRETPSPVIQSTRNDRGCNNSSRRIQSPELESSKNNYGDHNSRRKTPNSGLHSCRNDRRGNNSSRRVQSPVLESPENDYGNNNSRRGTPSPVIQSTRNDRGCNNSSRRIQSPGLESSKNNYGDHNSRRKTPNSGLHSCRNDRRGNNSSRRVQSPVLESPENDHGNNNSRGGTPSPVIQSTRNDRGCNNSSRRIQSPELESSKNNYGDHNSRRKTPNSGLHSCKNDRRGNNSSRRVQSPVLESPENDYGNNNSRRGTPSPVIQSTRNDRGCNNSSRRIQSPELESSKNNYGDHNSRRKTPNSGLHSCRNDRRGNNSSRRVQSPVLESPENDHGNNNSRGGTPSPVIQSTRNDRGCNNSNRRTQSPELESRKNNYDDNNSRRETPSPQLTKNACGDNDNSSREIDYMVPQSEQSEKSLETAPLNLRQVKGSTKYHTVKERMSKNYLSLSKDQNQHTSHRFQLTRMSTDEILDLRTRNSEGKVFVAKKPSKNKSISVNTACLEHDISRELLIRSLKPELRYKANFLSPPDEFKDNARRRITRLSQSVLKGVPPTPISPRQSSLIDEDSGDKITFSQKTILTNEKSNRKKGKDKKPKVPELVSKYLELSNKRTRRMESIGNAKRKLYSKDLSENRNSFSDLEGVQSFNSDRRSNIPSSSHPPTNNVNQGNIITEFNNDVEGNNVPHLVNTEELYNASTSSSRRSQASSSCAKNVDNFSSEKTQNEGEVFKKPKIPLKRRGRTKQKISKLPTISPAPPETSSSSTNSESSETSENTTGCRRSKRGPKPLKCYWSCTQTEYIPLWDIRLLKKSKNHYSRNNSNSIKRTNKKNGKSDNSIAISDNDVQATVERMPLASSTANSFGLNKDTIDTATQGCSNNVNTNVAGKRKYEKKSKRLTTIVEKKTANNIRNAVMAVDETSSGQNFSDPSDRQLVDDHRSFNAGQSPDPINIPCESNTVPIRRKSSIEMKKLRVLLPKLKLPTLNNKYGSSGADINHQNTDSGCCTANQLSTALPPASSPVENQNNMLDWVKNLLSSKPVDPIQENSIQDHFRSENFECARFGTIGCTKIGGIEYKFYKHEETLLLGYMCFEPKAEKKRVKLVKFDLILLVLHGKLEFEMDGQTGTVCSGDVLSIKKGTLYSVHNRDERISALTFVVKK